MSHAVIGVVGHVDHGKSALVRALTGIETDRLAEEKARGISIALGFAHMTVGDATLDLIDMPGHEKFVRTMIAGASGIDALLLVVAADEGIMPQTREHVAIAGLLGLSRAVVAISKADLADAAQARAVGEAARPLLAKAGIAVSAVVLTSARAGLGLDALSAALAELAGDAMPRGREAPAFLPVDRAFAVAGFGPVVTGTLRGGPLRAGDPLVLWPAGREVRLRGLQVHGAAVREAMAGQRVAANLRGVEVSELARGMAVAAPGALVESGWLTLDLSALPDAPRLTNGMAIHWLAGTAEGEGRLRLLEGERMEPGTRAFAQLRLTRPEALPVGEAVILRLPLPVGTVAGGRIVEAEAKRRRRGDAGVLARLALLRDGPVEAILAGEVARAGARGANLAALARLVGLVPGRVAQCLPGLGLEVTARGIVHSAAEMARRREKAQLAAALAPAQAKVATEQAERIERELATAGLTPPTPKELASDALRRHALELLLRRGVAIRCRDPAKDKEIIFHRDALEAARTRLAPLLGGEGLLVSEICAVLAISRKFAMPLLDHLDGIGFTRREGDRRVRG